MLKSKCPAYGKKCHNCGQPNHLTPCCPKLKKPAVNAVSQADTGQLQGAASADSYICHVGTRQHNPSAIYAEMMVSDKPTKFLVDSGAACNILPLLMLPSGTKLQPAATILRTYNGSTLPIEGTVEVSLENPATQQRHLVSFEVVKGDHMLILGAMVVQDLNLLTVNEGDFRCIDAVHASVQPLPSTKSEVLERYAAVFKDTVGELPNPVHLTLDQNVEPVIMPARKIPLSLEDSVKNELACLVSKGVLAPVDKAPEWVSQMAIVVKPTGALRICIDPRGLNKALVRECTELGLHALLARTEVCIF